MTWISEAYLKVFKGRFFWLTFHSKANWFEYAAQGQI